MPDLSPFRRVPLAHRGLHDRARGLPENSRAAARAAIAAGYGIECDIQASADGEAMVFHDDDLFRLTGRRGAITTQSAARLGTFGLAGGAETIPTLAEFLAGIAGRVPLLIEVKDQSGALGPGPGALETRIAGILARYDGPVALMSFNPHSVAALARLAPGIPRGLTSCAFDDPEFAIPGDHRARLASLADYGPAGCSFISHDRADLKNPAVARVKSSGAPILTWTIRTPAQEATARGIADNITFEGYAPAIPA